LVSITPEIELAMSDTNADRTKFKSARYGGKIGYAILRWVVRRVGVWFAYGLSLLVVPYYALVRFEARKAANHYLKNRFPHRDRLQYFMLSVRLFFEFGKIIIDQTVIGLLGKERASFEFPNKREIVDIVNKRNGLILLTAHVGAWQSVMMGMDGDVLPVHVVFQLEAHTRGQHVFDLSGTKAPFRIVTPDTSFGGLFEITRALRRKESVAIMGDRVFGDKVLETTFLGKTARLPITAYYLAAITGAEVVVLLATRTGPLSFKVDMECITKDLDRTLIRCDDVIHTLLERYASCLDRYVRSHPFMWFNFYDFWATSTPFSRSGQETGAVLHAEAVTIDRGRSPDVNQSPQT
jgi:predicted LPLAT superfamily acyltransferase